MFFAEVATGGVEGVAAWKLFQMRHCLNRWRNGLKCFNLWIMVLEEHQTQAAQVIYTERDKDDGAAKRRSPLTIPKPFRTCPSPQTGLQPSVLAWRP